MPLLCHSLEIALGPMVSPLVGAKAVPKGQVSGRPTRATIFYIPAVFCLLITIMFTTSLILLHAAL